MQTVAVDRVVGVGKNSAARRVGRRSEATRAGGAEREQDGGAGRRGRCRVTAGWASRTEARQVERRMCRALGGEAAARHRGFATTPFPRLAHASLPPCTRRRSARRMAGGA